MFIPVSAQTLHFIEGCEGCRLHAYQDSRGIWTIGVGFTHLNGHNVQPGDTLTQQECDRLFGITAQIYQNHVLALVKVPLTPNQLTALVSFAYNEGWEALHQSVLLKKLNAGDYKGAADGLLQYTRAGKDRFILKSRREKERSLFLAA